MICLCIASTLIAGCTTNSSTESQKQVTPTQSVEGTTSTETTESAKEKLETEPTSLPIANQEEDAYTVPDYSDHKFNDEYRFNTQLVDLTKLGEEKTLFAKIEPSTD